MVRLFYVLKNMQSDKFHFIQYYIYRAYFSYVSSIMVLIVLFALPAE